MKVQGIDARELTAFVSYVHSFYGPRGIYPMGASRRMIRAAIRKLRQSSEAIFCLDSFDRERVRDVLLSDFGLVWPE